MSLQPATAPASEEGQQWINLDDLTAVEGHVLIVVKIREYQPMEGNKYGGVNWPVLADLLVCSGARSGEVELNKRFIKGAQTRMLRGVNAPKPGQLAEAPIYSPGRELPLLVQFKSYKKDDGTEGRYLVFDLPTAAQLAEMERVHANGQGWTPAPVPPPVVVTAQPAPAQPPAQGGPTAEQLAQFAAWQAAQAQQQAPPVPTPAGPPADAPWRVAG